MHHSKMRIFIVLVALVASAMASPYEEKQDKDDLVYNGALQSLDNTEINDGKNWWAVSAQNMSS